MPAVAVPLPPAATRHDPAGTLTTTDVKAKFVNGKPQVIEAKISLKSQFEWDRFIRFMDRYAAEQGLGFEK